MADLEIEPLMEAGAREGAKESRDEMKCCEQSCSPTREIHWRL